MLELTVRKVQLHKVVFMGRIYRNLPEIPIPSDAKLNHYDGQVSIYSYASGTRRRMVIGKAASETTMYVNDNFRLKFPQLWNQHFGEKLPQISQIHAGLYGLALGIGLRSGLYKMVQEVFGPQNGNALMDYAVYSMRWRSSTTQLFEEEMRDQMRFSSKLYSDSWYSSFFSQKMSKDAIHQFRLRWLEYCVRSGTKEVWLCIDGSNIDCAARVDLAQPGHAKSLRQTEIVSFIWAVDAASGMPITWFVNPGGMPDCKAVDEIVRSLAASGIKVDGLILDRGFASQEVLDLITAKKMDYVVMLKSNVCGFVSMFEKYAEEIRWKVKHCVSDEAVFGIADQVKVFAQSKEESCVGLYFAGMSSARGSADLLRKVRRAGTEIQKQIDEGASRIAVPSEMKRFLNLTVEDGKPMLRYDYEAWQSAADEKGYHAIASSMEKTAEEMHQLYRLRDVSEKQFSILKSQLNGNTTRVHAEASIESRLCAAFIASLLRTTAQLACESLDLDINVMLRKADGAYLRYMPGDRYEAIHNLSTDFKKLLGQFDVAEGHLDHFAAEIESRRNNAIQSETRTLPELEVKRGPGRPKGSRNKKTLEREAEQAAAGIQPEEKPKRKPGRPKGSRNKATLEREAQQAAAGSTSQEEQPKRRPGRPKGSKNKKTLEREAEFAALAARAEAPQRKPGRPKGSKNRKTLAREAEEARLKAASQKRGPGRPKGSRNKPKPPSET